jgi:putative uridylyltransferase
MVVISSSTCNVSEDVLKKEFLKAKEISNLQSSQLKPFTKAEKIKDMDSKKLEDFKKAGLEAIKSGQVAVITMAGGQGTRLGTSSPKGMFKISMKDGSSVTPFKIQKERLEKLAKESGSSKLNWVIMTSSATHKETVDYFSKEIKYSAGKVSFFQQDSLPALDKEGKPLKIDSKGSFFMAPNGNGGLFESFKKSGELDKFKTDGIKWVHIVTVDNMLIKMADPVMIGSAIKNSSDVVSKSVNRLNPTEKIGVFAINSENKLVISEYSELSKESSSFTEANMASHLFSIEFLESASKTSLPFHLAEKKIPSSDSQTVTGFKLEKFIFDVLPMAKKPIVLNVERSLEFSPLKNASGMDSPQTCAADLEKIKSSK